MENSAVEWVVEELCIYDYEMKWLFAEEIQEAKQLEKKNQEAIAIEFAEWVVNNDYAWSTPKKELYQEFLKSKKNEANSI